MSSTSVGAASPPAGGSPLMRAACRCLNIQLLLTVPESPPGERHVSLLEELMQTSDPAAIADGQRKTQPVFISLPRGLTWLAVGADYLASMLSSSSEASSAASESTVSDGDRLGRPGSSVLYPDLTSPVPLAPTSDASASPLLAFTCCLCKTRCFLYRETDRPVQASATGVAPQQLPALLDGQAVVDPNELGRLVERAADSWFQLALPDDSSDDKEFAHPLAEAFTEDASANQRRLDDRFRARKAQADTALELRLSQLVERERAAHVARVERARAELARMRRALLAQQQEQKLTHANSAVEKETTATSASANPVAASPTSGSSSSSSASSLAIDEVDDGKPDADEDPFEQPDAGKADKDETEEEEEEDSQQQQQRMLLLLGQSLPVGIVANASRRPAPNTEEAPARASTEDFAAAAAAAAAAEAALPDPAEFKGMTDAERLYVMQAVSYRCTASVREHDQFGSRGPPYLRQLAEKARLARRGRRQRGLSVPDEEEAVAEAPTAAAAASGGVAAASLPPQPRTLRANTVSVDMSRAFRLL